MCSQRETHRTGEKERRVFFAVADLLRPVCMEEFVSTAGVFSRLHALCLKTFVLISSPQFTVSCSFTFTLISVSMYH